MEQVVILIPARYASTRLPGKPLIEIAGRPMIQHVYERAMACRHASRVVVATDDDRIAEMVAGFDGEVVMTPTELCSGTDRIATAAVSILGANPDTNTIIVNIQGDEPMIEPSMVDTLIEALCATDCDCATLVTPIYTSRELFDTNVVKAVLRRDFSALYFSRSPIPCIRDRMAEEWVTLHTFYRHIGVYAYRYGALQRLVSAPSSQLEVHESLEQLRMLDLGLSIFCVETQYAGHAVDTAEDVMRVEQLMGG